MVKDTIKVRASSAHLKGKRLRDMPTLSLKFNSLQPQESQNQRAAEPKMSKLWNISFLFVWQADFSIGKIMVQNRNGQTMPN